MNILSSSKSVNELKSNYRKLANRYHPDRGGNTHIMQKINTLYKQLLAEMKTRHYDDFTHVTVGMTVYVNGTECEVLEVSTNTFRVVAVGRTRQAQFFKDNGIGRFNSRLIARYQNPH